MIRLGALAAIVAGPLFVVSQATEQTALAPASTMLFALGLLALQAVQRRFWSTSQIMFVQQKGAKGLFD